MIQDFPPLKNKPRHILALTSQSGAIDLRVAYETGVVSGDLENIEGNFNGIEDPGSIMGSPGDVFEALRASDALKSVGAPAPSQSPASET